MRFIAAIVVAVAAIVGLLVFVAVAGSPAAAQPGRDRGGAAPQADSDACRALMDALPEQLGDYRARRGREPAPAGAAAWQDDDRAAVTR